MAAETIVMLPIALGYIGYLTIQGESTFGNEGATHTVLMICSGLVTALPLLCFAKGAKLIPLATVGMLQYTTPILQVLWAVYVTQEHMPAERWIGFGIIWVAVIIYLADLLRQHRKAKKQARGPVEIRKINPEQVPDT